jgi:NTP pyrophosphatase (non-canonical NTP hydrolase)
MTFKDYEDVGIPSDTIFAVHEESERQIKKWGVQKRKLMEWLCFTTEELGELAEAIAEHEYREGKKEDIIKEAIQTATLCLKIASMVSASQDSEHDEIEDINRECSEDVSETEE